jgi:hypothetical protein
MFFTFPKDARWNAEWSAVEFGSRSAATARWFGVLDQYDASNRGFHEHDLAQAIAEAAGPAEDRRDAEQHAVWAEISFNFMPSSGPDGSVWETYFAPSMTATQQAPPQGFGGRQVRLGAVVVLSLPLPALSCCATGAGELVKFGQPVWYALLLQDRR